MMKYLFTTPTPRDFKLFAIEDGHKLLFKRPYFADGGVCWKFYGV